MAWQCLAACRSPEPFLLLLHDGVVRAQLYLWLGSSIGYDCRPLAPSDNHGQKDGVQGRAVSSVRQFHFLPHCRWSLFLTRFVPMVFENKLQGIE